MWQGGKRRRGIRWGCEGGLVGVEERECVYIGIPERDLRGVYGAHV